MSDDHVISVLRETYSTFSRPADQVTSGEPEVGIEAGLALASIVVSASRRYSDSGKILHLTKPGKRSAERTQAHIVSEAKRV